MAKNSHRHTDAAFNNYSLLHEQQLI